MSGSKQFTPRFEGTLTLELTVETAPGEQAEGVDHSQPTLALTVEHAEIRSPIEMQVASEDHPAFQVLIRAEVAMDATGGLKRRPGEGMGRRDDASTVWGDDTNRPAGATRQPHSPQDTADRPAPLEATRPSRGGESAPAEQHSRQKVHRGS